MVAVDVSPPGERLIHGRLDAPAFLVRTISDDAPTLLLIGTATDRHGMAVREGVGSGLGCGGVAGGFAYLLSIGRWPTSDRTVDLSQFGWR